MAFPHHNSLKKYISYSKSCESSGDVSKILCPLEPSQDNKKFHNVRHEVVSIFQFCSLNQNLLDVSIFLQNLTFLVVLDVERLHIRESDLK